ncbi:EAL domain-containing protein [Rhizobiaceae bacterium]|nr:EAL domain-containing protein [Rhizobiaceae bacterium]
MESNVGLRTLLARLFIAACILVTVAAGAFVLNRTFGVAVPVTVLLATMALAISAVVGRQVLLAGEVSTLRAQVSAETAFRDALEEQLGKLEATDAATLQIIQTLAQRRARRPKATAPPALNPASALLEQPAAQPQPQPEPQQEVQPEVRPQQHPEPEHGPDTQTDAPDIIPVDTSRQAPLAMPQRIVAPRDDVRIHLQPIVALPSRQPSHFEITLRLTDDGDKTLDARMSRNALAAQGRLAEAGMHLLSTAMPIARRLSQLPRAARVLCPLAPDLLEDEDRFDEVLALLARAERSAWPVLQLRQRSLARFGLEERGRMWTLRDVGHVFALDEVADTALDASELAADGIAYLRVDVDVAMRAKDHDSLGQSGLETFAPEMERAGIALIAGNVVRESQMEALAAHPAGTSVLLAQGELFAPPRPVRQDLAAS